MASTTLPSLTPAVEMPPGARESAPGSVVVFPAGGRSGRRETTSADALFTAMDGRSIALFGRDYQIQVYGVAEISGARWLQLGLDGAGQRLLTLRLPLGASVSRAMHALFVELAEANAQAYELAMA